MSNPGAFRRPWFKKKEPQVNPKLVSAAVNFNVEPKHGYCGFSLYFPQEDDSKVETLLRCVNRFEKFIARNVTMFSFSDIEAQKFFSVDYKFVTSDEQLCADWEDFTTEIITNTEFCLNCMGLAVHQSIINDFLNKNKDSEEGITQKKSLSIIRARLINYEPIQCIKDIRVINYGKLVSLRGTVIKAANVKIMYQYMAFSCSTCTGIQLLKLQDNIHSVPNKCTTDGCRAQSNFKPLQNSPYTRTISWQSIKIQELIGSDEFENGRVPRTLECELTEDLVNSCIPGDDITITGIIKVRNNEFTYKNKQNSVFLLYLEVISILNNKNQSQGSYGASELITFNMTDYYAIEKIHAEPNLFRFLVQSLCPSIFGHELVKAGLALALFGGTKSDKNRAESHVLMVGDPGLGKSQMLQACVNVAPRGVYVCGNTSTGSGLTVTMTRESGGEYALEAGALMLADQGCCCIDEFDKMPTQHASLLEAMEQQTISIAKAGIVSTIPTRATILAAANPAGGHYNKAKTISENLKISSPILSRFDLIFILLDQPNEEMDVKLSEHVLALHSGKSGSDSTLNKDLSRLSMTNNDSLRGRLGLQNGEDFDHLSHSLFRKYIAYAQKYVHPQLSEEAKQVLKEFYFQLRKQYQTGDSTPITTRQLTSLIRLSQARAKIELREEVTREDASDVVEIMKETLVDIFTDNRGVLDTTRTSTGSRMSTKNQIKKLLRLMQAKSESQTKSVFTTNEIREMSEEAGINQLKFFSVLESLNIQGFILNKGANKYQLVTADL